MPLHHGFSHAVRPLVLAGLVLALGACDSGEPDPPPTPTDTVLFGLNYTRLFAPPTAAEVSAVKASWTSRAPASSAPTVVGEATIDGANLKIVSHTVTATGCETVTHYAAVRTPAGLTGPAPLLVIHHGGDDGFSIDADNGNTGLVDMAAIYPELFARTIQVAPVYRSEELRTNGIAGLGPNRTATGAASPWDCDVDDAMATVSAVLAAFPTAVSATQRAVLGYSRGGNTAALHAVRDPEMDALVEYYGPTDFYNDAVQLLTTGVLTNNATALGLPGAQYLRDNVLLPLIGTGGTYNPNADYASARLAVARRSASLFTADFPDTQVHHHYRDSVVPYTFTQALVAREAAQGSGGTFEVFSYGTPAAAATDLSGEFHRPEAMPESYARVQTFLRAQLGI